MANKLKHFRVAAGVTQTAIAKAVGVTQPTYQRWEVGSVDVPEAKLAKLADALKTTIEALMGRHPPISAALYDDSAPRDLQYYGEVAVHFKGGSDALLLSISEEARQKIFGELRRDSKFLTIKDLGNRTVVIRKTAISDLYLSSEAYDDHGPEHREPGYEHGTPLQLPDPRDWEIIEGLACDDVGLEEFSDEDVKRVQSAVLITDEQYEDLVTDGLIKPEDLEAEKTKNAASTTAIFELATSVVYQLTVGRRRSINIIDCNLYEAFGDLVDDDGGRFDEDPTLILQSEGYHRAIVINLEAVDYISIPSHLLENSSDDVSAALLDEAGQ